MSFEVTAEIRLRQQAIDYYAALMLWPLYLFLLPAVWAYCGGWVIVYMIFPGLYLFTWIGYLMHESWHRYVPNVHHRFFYHAFALLLLLDPQLYHILHGSHHSQVHTYQDAEFYPIGEIKSRKIRIFYNWLEFIFGVAFILVMATWSVPRDARFAQKYCWWKLPLAALGWSVAFGGIGYLSHWAFGVSAEQVALAYLLNLWLGSFFLHQSQLIEHGNLIVEGSIHQRDRYTRNLKPSGRLEKLFLFLTHNDTLEHVLHHTVVKTHSRPFPNELAMPDSAVMITLGDYLKIAARMLCGEVERIGQPA